MVLEGRKLVKYRPLTRYPFLRCSPICFGTVEVYRRICLLLSAGRHQPQ